MTTKEQPFSISVMASVRRCGFFWLVLGLWTASPATSQIQIDLDCQPGWQLIGHGCYRLFDTPLPWTMADNACTSYGGHLAIPLDYQENEDLGQFVNNQSITEFWIGYNGGDRVNAPANDRRVLYTSDGEEVFLWVGRWDRDEPSFTTDGCALMHTNDEISWGGQPTTGRQRWKLASCDRKLPLLCQRPVCSAGSFHCHSGRCIVPGIKCDNFDDCGDRSDELECDQHCTQKIFVDEPGTYNFPQNLSNPVQGNVDCTLVMEAAVGENIELKITSLDLIPGSEELIIMDGSLTEDTSREVKRLTGSVHTDQFFYSSNNMMILRARSTLPAGSGMVYATYRPVARSPDVTTPLVATDTPKELEWPMYGTYELGNQDISYVIQAENPRRTLTIEIVDSDLAPGTEVVFHDGDSAQGDLLATLQDTNFGDGYVLTKGRTVYVAKRTGLGGPHKGLKIRYWQGCSVTKEAASGYITSPGFVNGVYPSGVTCTWTIRHPNSSQISIKFDKLDIGDDDSLKIANDSGAVLKSFPESAGRTPLSAPDGIFHLTLTTTFTDNDGSFKISFSPDCPTPDLDLDKSTILPGVNLNYGSRFIVSCKPGYTFAQSEHIDSGTVRMVCGMDGQWSVRTSPKCMPFVCPEAQDLENGYIANSTGGFVSAGVLTYACYDGFTLTGDANVVCQDGTWSTMPTCDTANCTALPLGPENGSQDNVGGSTSYGTIVRFSCDAGYDLLGGTTMMCDSNGHWVGTMPTCEIQSCYTRDIPNGVLSNNTADVNQNVTLTCDAGYESTVNGSVEMTCGVDRLFTPELGCKNIDECVVANPCSQTCEDLPGTYKCSCGSGYLEEDDNCMDIDECSAETPCDGTCENFPGGFSCACPDGYALFVQDGTEDHVIPAGDDGFGDLDTYRINKSCVRKRCNAYTPPENAITQTQGFKFYYNDTLTVRCKDGFQKTDPASGVLTCDADRNWVGPTITCEQIVCDIPPVPGDLINPGVLSTTNATIPLGEILEIRCRVEGREDFNSTRRCTIIDGEYRLDGSDADYECGVIDCGQPEVLVGTILTDKTGGTRYGGSATYGCDTLYTLSGSSILYNNATITCQANGQWDLGDLYCSGKRCTDPGQIHLGVQVDSDYRSAVTFMCSEPGYELQPPDPLTCQLSADGTASYNASLPECVDVTKPVLQGDCSSGTLVIKVDKFSSVSAAIPDITAIDSESGVKEMMVAPSWPPRDEYVTSVAETLSYTYKFVDHADNVATCNVTLSAKDAMPPSITCPATIEKIFRTATEVVSLEFDRDNVTVEDDNTDEGNIAVSFSPAQYTFNASSEQLLTSFPPTFRKVIEATAKDETGNTASCSFDVFFKPDVCSQYYIRQPLNGSLACEDLASGGVNCTVTCDTGFRLRHNLAAESETVTCPSAGHPFSKTDFKCVEIDLSELEGTYQVLYKADYSSTNASESCRDNYNSIITSTLDTIGDKIVTFTCKNLITPVLGKGYLSNLAVDEGNNKVTVEIAVRMVRNPGSNYVICRPSLTEHLKIARSVQDLKILESFLPSVCPKLSLVGQGFTFIKEEFLCEDENTPATPYAHNNGQVDRIAGLCLKCPRGTFKGGAGACIQCPAGTFGDGLDLVTCSSCPTNTSTYTDGAISVAQCSDMCEAGTINPVSGLGPCIPCEQGSFWANATTCLPCPGNSTTKFAGAKSQNECVDPCQVGFFNEVDGYAPCQPCPRHTYANETAAKVCHQCDDGKYTETMGSSSEANCRPLSESTECEGRCVNGACEENLHSKSCKCTTGWWGENCDKVFDPCSSTPCHNGGNCNSSGLNFTCACPTGTSGDVCQVIEPSCTNTTCLNGGMCENIVSGARCHCLQHFSGNRCEVRDDACDSQPCKNGGTCVSYGHFRISCKCADGYTGAFCEELEDACFTRPCRNNGTCRTTGPRTYTCDCDTAPGYSGPMCEQREELCNDPSATCGIGALCFQDYKNREVICACPPGKVYPDPDGPQNQTCVSPDVCDPNPCMNEATCSDVNGAPSCNCLQGFNGSRCQYDIDWCTNMPCLNGGECVDELLGYSCNCSAGFTGSVCEVNTDECTSNNCSLAGTKQCEDLINDYECVCNDGYGGRYCETNLDDCASQPCLHGGTCEDQVNKYKCNCLPGWSGDNCETEKKFCESGPCENEAECKNLFNNFYCKCQANTFGVDCSQAVDICDVANPCIQGSCSVSGGNASCTCYDDYTGDQCQERIDPCKAGVCQNSAVCVPSLDDYECQCQPGFTGRDCNTIVNNCSPTSCNNNATCLNMRDTFACRCPLGKEGPRCSQDTDSNFDLLFRHSEKISMAALQYPIAVDSNSFSLALWIKFDEFVGTGTVLSVFTVPDPSSLSNKQLLLQLNETGVLYQEPGTNTTAEIMYPVPDVNNGEWHYIVINVNGQAGELRAIVDTVQNNPMAISPGSFDSHVWVVLGCQYDTETDEPVPEGGFHGRLSKVTLYNRTLSFRDEVTLVGNSNVDALFDDSILRWGQEFALFGGVRRIVPSRADNTCPDGFNCTERTTARASLTISSGQCPADTLKYTQSRLTEVTYRVPTFTGQDSVRTSLSTEDMYGWGLYPVIIEASNSDGDKALCLFKIYVQNDQCKSPPNPPNSEALHCLPTDSLDYQAAGYRQCAVKCKTGFAPSVPGPHLHTCGPSGNWEPGQRFLPFRLSPCGTVRPAMNNLIIVVNYRVISRECLAITRTLTAKFKEAQVTLNGKWNRVCSQNDCSDSIIIVKCLSSRRRRRRRNASFDVEATLTLPDVSAMVVNIASNQNVSISSLYDGLLFAETDNPFDFSAFVSDAFPVSYSISLEGQCEAPSVYSNDECVECGPGTFYNNASESCEFCPVGTYQTLQSQFACTACPDESTTQQYGSYDDNDCKEKCKPGQFFDVDIDQCQNCSRGFYQPEAGQFSCLACEADKTTKFEGTVLESSCSNDCPAGQEIGTNNDCVVCPIGTYRSREDPLCIRCPDGNVTMYNESKSISDCNVADNPAGTYRDPSQPWLHHKCPVEQYQPLKWQDQCLPCGDGYRARQPGATDQSQCQFHCPAGQQKKTGEDSCEPCPLGTHRDGSKVFAPCDQCSGPYTTLNTGAISQDNCTLYQCPAGSQPNDAQTVCDLCPLGQYQDRENQARCLECADMESTRNEGSTNASSCEAYCPSGSERNATGTNCITCQRGYFKDNTFNVFSNCEPCLNSSYTTEFGGATSNDNCTVLSCSEGYKGNMVTNQCEICPKGTYQDQKYQTSCNPCSDGQFTRSEGSKAASDCETYCPPGEEKNGTSCIPCDRGFYKNNDGDPFMVCTACSNSSFTTDGPSATHQDNCTVLSCSEGYMGNTWTYQCEICPKGTYQDKKYQTSCNPCSDGKFTRSEGSTAASDCEAYCPPGEEKNGTSCIPCDRGFYKNNDGDPFMVCTACSNSSFTTDGPSATHQDNCTVPNCGPGTYITGDTCSPCPKGQWQNESLSESCNPCPTNKNTAETGATGIEKCLLHCPAGAQNPPGTSSCELCPPAYYKDTAGTTSCEPCDNFDNNNIYISTESGTDSKAGCNKLVCTAGYYPVDNTTCTRCPHGKYQDKKWQDACEPCPIGLTTYREGAVDQAQCLPDCEPGQGLYGGQCRPCAVDEYNDDADPNRRICYSCSPGFITSGTGSTSEAACSITDCSVIGQFRNVTTNQCQDCPVGQYQNETRQDSCKPCGNGMTTKNVGSTSMADCKADCPSGQYLNETSNMCKPCPAGSYRSTSIGQYTWTCDQCIDQLTTAGTGHDSIDDCNVPTCGAGSAYNRTERRCQTCPLHTYQDAAGRYMPCTSCPVNQVTAQTGTSQAAGCFLPCSTGARCSITSETCVNDASQPLGYRCDCKADYLLVGNTCQHKCTQANYCGEKGTCYRSPFQCLCRDGYTGDRCQNRPAASSQSKDEAETLVIAVVAAVGGLLLLILLLVCICVLARRRSSRSSKTHTTSEGDDRLSLASRSMKTYDDLPTFAMNPAFSSKPPSMFLGQGMNAQGFKTYSNPHLTDEDNDPAVYRA